MGADDEITFQDFLLQVCMRCIACDKTPEDEQVCTRVTQLNRYALTVLHQILLNPHATALAGRHLEDVLIQRLMQSLQGPDPYIQVLLLDVVYASLKLRETLSAELPTSPTRERRVTSDAPTNPSRLSLTADRPPLMLPPPPALLKCLQAGLASANSSTILDSWVSFLGECLPFYSESIFQVLIPLVETLCRQVAGTFGKLKAIFGEVSSEISKEPSTPESTLISLLNGLERVLATGHDRLLVEERDDREDDVDRFVRLVRLRGDAAGGWATEK